MTTRTITADPALDHYEDISECEVSPRCLECPLPQCKYDMGGNPGQAIQFLRRQKRHREVMVWWRERPEVPARVVAKHFGVTTRTVYRIQAASHGH